MTSKENEITVTSRNHSTLEETSPQVRGREARPKGLQACQLPVVQFSIQNSKGHNYKINICEVIKDDWN